MSLFSNLKEKLTAKLDEFKTATVPGDPLEKQAFELVQKATSEALISPDWNANLSCVDFINSDVRLSSGRVLRALKQSMGKPNGKVQSLTLTLLETCVKNCAADFHAHLAASELWQDLLTIASGAAVPPVDAEVRDQVLALVEDFARALAPAQFQTAYEALLDQGINFPARSVDDSAPYLTPPAAVGGGAADTGPADADAAAAAAAAVAAAGGPDAGVGAGAEDPLAGVDEQDRAAIQAALAELELEAQAAQDAERVAAEADAEERRRLAAAQEQQRQQEQQQAETAAAAGLIFAAESATAAAATAAAAQASHAPHAAAPAAAHAPHAAEGAGAVAAGGEQQDEEAAAAAAAAAAAEEEEARETPAERATKLMEMCSNSCLLLSEMLAGIPDTEPLGVREPYVAELADEVVRLRSRLERVIGGGGPELEEALLASALSQHEELSRVLARHDELLAAAESIAPSPPPPQPRQPRQPRQAVPPPLPHEALPPHAHQFRGSSAAAGSAPGAAASEPDALDVASQKVAAAAAVIKEKVTGAFDKLAASWATYRSGAAAGGAASGASSMPLLGAAYEPAAGASPGGGGGGGVLHDGGASGGGGGHFTLADDDEEAEEGGSLVAKRTGGPAAVLPPPAAALPPQAAAAPLPVAPPLQPVSSVQGPDLINFDDEPAVAPAPAAAADLLAPAAAEHAAVAAPPPAVGGGGVSWAVSNNDQLVEALDRLVSAESGTPLAGAGGSGVAAAAAAAAAAAGLAEVPAAAAAEAEAAEAKPAH